jgi:hypothetical protein
MGQKKRRFTRPSRQEMKTFRKFLGPELMKQYRPRQLPALYYDMHIAAKLLLDLWIEKKKMEN